MDAHDTVMKKVLDIFREAVGDPAKWLDGSVIATPAMEAITDALADEYGYEKAADIAFHMSDWNWNAAFVVALHLYPERFSKEEVDAGIGLFLIHAPNHIRAACQLTDTYVWENFPDPDETG